MHTTRLSLIKLKRILNYDPDTGLFTYLVDRNYNAMKGMVAGHVHKKYGYVRIVIDGYTYDAHVLAWYYMTGEWPNVIDHDNRIRHDNRWVNLKNGTQSDNMKNTERTKFATINGITKSTSSWAFELGLNLRTVQKRIQKGMSPEQALGVK